MRIRRPGPNQAKLRLRRWAMGPPGCTWEIRDESPEVLFVTNMWPDTVRPVYGIFVQRQVESLRDVGVGCDVLYVRGYKGLCIYAIAISWFFANAGAVRKKYRLIHAHAGETALVVSVARRIVKVASYCGDDLLGQARPDGSMSRAAELRRWLIRQSARFCDATITKSREMESVLPAGLRHRNFVVPNGVDEQEFCPTARSEARRLLKWDLDKRAVIFVATRPHEPRKRLHLAELAVSEAEREVGPIWLFVAENVAPKELPLLMSAADCLLLTSRMEGSPNAVKEALMSNLPVISTDVGDVAELLDGVEHSGVYQDSQYELGAALAAVLRSPVRSDGREKAGYLTQGAIAERILDIYRDKARYRL